MSRLSRAVRKMLGMKRLHTRGSAAPPAASRVPDFFICGAARSGTTSLWEYLRQHPDVYMPTSIGDKEPSYFCDLYGMTDWQAYLSLFRDAGNRKRVGEASGPYLTSPESAGLIKAAVPNARMASACALRPLKARAAAGLMVPRACTGALRKPWPRSGRATCAGALPRTGAARAARPCDAGA